MDNMEFEKLYAVLKNIENGCNARATELDLVKKDNEQLGMTIARLENENRSLKHLEPKIADLAAENQTMHAELARLKQLVSSLEEEKLAFTKVSHIINLERENTRLKTEIEALRTKKTQPLVEEVPKMKEKKIKGVCYLLSDKDELFEKNEDGSAGKMAGRLEKIADGKQKVVWC